MKDILIKLQSVSKIYDGWRTALGNVDLEIEKGEFLLLVGPNGAGKTTLLKLLWMEEEPSSGTIFIDKYNSLGNNSKRLSELRQKIGVVFEDLKLLREKTLEENLSLPLRLSGKKEKYIKSRTTELLGAFNLYPKRKSLPQEVSAGERKKLAIARAVANEPLIILADEPFGGLDQKVSFEIIDFFREINLKGSTVLLTTYRTDIAQSFKWRVVQLEKGEIKK
ncbi:MAG TPA: ATP-binding cassette domain-containing protein [Terriglobales bacterium]|nr:ATP-binding cassette domain-containing protein [Terriglobales bacterium]